MASGGKFTVPSGEALTVRQLMHLLSDFPKDKLDTPFVVMGAYGKVQNAGFLDSSPNKTTGQIERVVVGAHQAKRIPGYVRPGAQVKSAA